MRRKENIATEGSFFQVAVDSILLSFSLQEQCLNLFGTWTGGMGDQGYRNKEVFCLVLIQSPSSGGLRA